MESNTMKAIIKETPRPDREWKKGLALAEVPIPEITEPTEVKIEVIATAICGTDVGIYNSKQSLKDEMISNSAPYVVIGHEFAGRIVDAGEVARKHLAGLLFERVSDDKTLIDFVGRRNVDELAKDVDLINVLKENFIVSAEMHITCGRCHQCRLGQRHVCQNTKIKGIHEDGVFTRFVKVPAENVVLFKKGELPVEIIALMDAIGNAVHTAQSVNLMGQTVAILGCGVQGLMATAIAKMSGASKIFVTDASKPGTGATHEKIVEKRFSMAKKFGADFCFDVAIPEEREKFIKTVKSETQGTGVDVVFEMSGNYKAYQDAFEVIRMGGTISLLGLPEGDVNIDFSKNVIFKGITIHGIIGRRVFETWEVMRSLLKSGLADKILEAGFVTHQLPLERFEEGFEAIRNGDGLKVILKPS
jgi:threonine 3-dehydrogenase